LSMTVFDLISNIRMLRLVMERIMLVLRLALLGLGVVNRVRLGNAV